MPQSLPAESLVDALSGRILDLIDSGVSTPVLIIDGRSASGKTTLAAQLQNKLFKDGETAPRVIHMDDLYDGWYGLQAGHDYLVRSILKPLSQRKVSGWQEYDWALGERNQWREFEGGTPLIIEGCGSLSQSTRQFAHFALWLEAEEAVRQHRWVERSGHDHDQWWPIWAAQELEFYARERSAELADFTCVNG
ncbi:MAG: hypothetical protein RL243_317 [Actinomycetota bacterium]